MTQQADQPAIVLGICMYLRADGTVRIMTAPDSPREADLNDVRTLVARAQADVNVRIITDSVVQEVTRDQREMVKKMTAASQQLQSERQALAHETEQLNALRERVRAESASLRDARERGVETPPGPAALPND